MQRRILTLAVLLTMFTVIVGCNTLPAPAPAPLPALTAQVTLTKSVCQVHPSITLSSNTNSVKVGEMLTLSTSITDVGMPQITLTLTSGAKVTVPYGAGTPQKTDDSIFEIVSATGQKFVLRGKTAGSANAIVSANGEEGCFDTGYYSGTVGSAPLRIEVTP